MRAGAVREGGEILGDNGGEGDGAVGGDGDSGG